MSTTDDVLDAIDQALHDMSVSTDAMRWTPRPADEVYDEEQDRTIRASVRSINGVAMLSAVVNGVEWVAPLGSFPDLIPGRRPGDPWMTLADYRYTAARRGIHRPPSRDAARVPEMGESIPGMHRYMLIGGPLHGDIRAIPDGLLTWVVAIYPSFNNSLLPSTADGASVVPPVMDYPFSYAAHKFALPGIVFMYYACGGTPEPQDVVELLSYWTNRGWFPEDHRPWHH